MRGLDCSVRVGLAVDVGISDCQTPRPKVPARSRPRALSICKEEMITPGR
jgi:hypothetical protein